MYLNGKFFEAAQGYVSILILSVILALSIVAVLRPSPPAGVKSPVIYDPIPFIFNTIQFVFNNDKFMSRATKALEKTPIVKFWLAGKPVYLVAGLKQYQNIFASRDLTYNGIMLQIGFPRLYRMSKSEVKRFENDRTGHKETPRPGTEHVPPEQRYWAPKYHVLYDFLSRPHHIKPIVDEFQRQFSEVLERYPVGDWSTLSIDKLTRGDFTRCAITTLFGPKIFEVNPDFLDAFWKYDSYVSVLVYGFPEWIYPAPYKASDRFLDRIEKYVDAGLKNFDWNGPKVEAQWEPHFGTRITRELTKWLVDAGFRRKSVAGALGTLVFAQNSNTIPVVTWMLMELNTDPDLLNASLFTEILRLRVSMVIMRVVDEPMSIGGVNIAKGSLLHAYSRVAHTDEDTWRVMGHPADQFWAERHIKYIEERDQTGQIHRRREFVMAASPAYFFPFGGGVPICPGRQFAKMEVFTMVGLLVDRFDMEFIKWTKFDGSPSDRPAENDRRFSGIGSLPPDRDMIVRWKRIW